MSKNKKRKQTPINSQKNTKKVFCLAPAHVELFQNVSAEDDNDVVHAKRYVENPFFHIASDFKSKKCFLVGRTGVGKSAIIKRIHSSLDENARITIQPEEFSFNLLLQSETLPILESSSVNLDYLYKTIWNYVFLTKIFEKISPDYTGVLRMLENIFRKNDAYNSYVKFSEITKTANGNIGKGVLNILSEFDKSLKTRLNAGVIDVEFAMNKRADLQSEISRTVTSLNYSGIQELLDNLDEKVLNRNITIFIDDLDKSWVQQHSSVKLISCLFAAIPEFMQKTSKVKFLVSLRTNIFSQLKMNQSEKYIRYIQKIDWNERDLKAIITRKLQAIEELSGSPTGKIWQDMLPNKINVSGQGASIPIEKYIGLMSNYRPRDASLLLSFAMEKALGKATISANDLKSIESMYSKERLKALFEEWDDPYKGIDFVLDALPNNLRSKYTYDLFCKEVSQLVVLWMTEKKEEDHDRYSWIKLYPVPNNSSAEASYRYVAELLFEIGLIGVKYDHTSPVIYSFNSNSILDSSRLTSSKIEINNVYRRALGVSSAQSSIDSEQIAA